ncbi:phosphoenolpyruvate carboxykinase [candidate division KSB1 bacterium]|nr:phosphoenolpyruvate carboxykinase [candidate division KSB1 bacterium]
MEQYRSEAFKELEKHGIKNVSNAWFNLSTPALYEYAVRRLEGHIAHLGPFVVTTGHHTGRSPNDKFIVREPSSEKNIWWGDVNRDFDASKFENLHNRLLAYLQGKDLFVQDCYACADPNYRISVRVITETAWHNIFAKNLFIQVPREELGNFQPDFTIINAPRFHAIPQVDGTSSEVFIIVNFAKKLILIGGSSYAGEIKKSVFTILNYLLPIGANGKNKVLSMHCSANVGNDNDVALFFGLSGTGKTTLSADPNRGLIGDDEHGWSDDGVFNFEGGCYAKVIRLSAEAEPEIYQTTRMFGTILENVAINMETRRLDLDDAALTENTRAAYPISSIPNAVIPGVADHPQNILMLTADAFGVLPPIAKLTQEQAMYHFLSGYTAKVAGTEKGLSNEPTATFSTCFGAPFMALHPTVYAQLLGDKMAKHNVDCWLVNTGWSGGPYGVGERMKIAYTRAMVTAVLDGSLADIPTEEDPIFGVHIPTACPNVPAEVLKPKNTWQDKASYDEYANKLADMFKKNFEQFQEHVSERVLKAGPR